MTTTLSPLDWESHFEAFLQSKLTRKKYCQRHDLIYHQFQYHWKQYSKKQKLVKKVPSVKFAPLTLTSTPPTESRLEIRFSSGVIYFIPPGFDEHLLKMLIKVIR